MRIAVVFNKDRADTTGIYFERALVSLGHEVIHCPDRDSARLPDGCDLYFKVDDGNYTEDLPDRLRPRVYWVSDTHLAKPLKALRRLTRSYDLAFVAMREGTEQLRRSGTQAVWAYGGACDPEIHRKLDVPKRYDVGFVGTDGGIPRKFYLQALRERYPSSFIGGAPHTQMSEIYSQSKIGFNWALAGETLTMRSFEIMACGAMLLLNAVRDEAQDLLGFVPGQHLVLYHTPKELFELADYYVSHDAEREAIAERGHRLAVERHTYRHRMQFMLETAGQRLGSRYPQLASAALAQPARIMA